MINTKERSEGQELMERTRKNYKRIQSASFFKLNIEERNDSASVFLINIF